MITILAKTVLFSFLIWAGIKLADYDLLRYNLSRSRAVPLLFLTMIIMGSGIVGLMGLILGFTGVDTVWVAD